MAVDPRLIDQDVAASLASLAAGGKSDFVEKVQNLYRENAPASVAHLLAAVEAGDAEAAAKAAHALKSMSLNIGAKEVAKRSAEMELSSRDGNPPDRQAVLALEQVLKDTLAALSGGAPAVAAPPGRDPRSGPPLSPRPRRRR